MSHPMMGTGIDSYKRVAPDWAMCEQILTLLTSPDTPSTKKGIGRNMLQSIYRVLMDNKPITSWECAFWLPHGGAKWGNRFTVLEHKAVTKRIRRNRRRTFETLNQKPIRRR
ncbi:MAG: hypothetical protein GY906_24570 [bacterium]|nr:hypothetical protein [bacterium]